MYVSIIHYQKEAHPRTQPCATISVTAELLLIMVHSVSECLWLQYLFQCNVICELIEGLPILTSCAYLIAPSSSASHLVPPSE